MSGEPQDPQAFDEMMRSWIGPLRRQVARRVPPDAVDDVVQEVLLAFWQASGHVHVAAPDRLLQRLVQRKSADWHRQANRAASGETVGTVSIDSDETGWILSQLGMANTSLIWRRVVDDAPLDRLAAEFGVPLGTVKWRLHEEARALRHRLHDWRHPEHAGTPLVAHAKAGCATCQQTYAHLVRRAFPHRWFQAMAVSCDSALALSVDARLWTPPLTESQVVVSQPGDWPLPTLVSDSGTNLTGRFTRVGPSRQAAFRLNPHDAGPLRLAHRFSAAVAEELQLIRVSKHGAELLLNVNCVPELDDVLWVQLPANVEPSHIQHIDPAPTARFVVHGATAIMWRHTNLLAGSPRITLHW